MSIWGPPKGGEYELEYYDQSHPETSSPFEFKAPSLAEALKVAWRVRQGGGKPLRITRTVSGELSVVLSKDEIELACVRIDVLDRPGNSLLVMAEQVIGEMGKE